MSTIHFVNGGAGDCIVLDHAGGHRAVVDICGGNRARKAEAGRAARLEGRKAAGNFQMCQAPVNPLDYLDHAVGGKVFRFISTHPDMDHLDGIESLFAEYEVLNFWWAGAERDKPEFGEDAPWEEADWDRYEDLRSGNVDGTKTLRKQAGDRFAYANQDEDGEGGGDGLYILAPNGDLVAEAEESEDWNDASYVILYRSVGGRALFPGDAHDDTWEYVLDRYEDDVRNVRLLTAPHHGRHSDRSFEFLDVLQPEFTILGCAPSATLAYDAWRSRNLDYVTTNQAGCIVAECHDDQMDIFIENESYAQQAEGADPTRTNNIGYYFLRTLD